jgi:hypothetical protein
VAYFSVHFTNMYNFTSTSAATAAAVAHPRHRPHALIALAQVAVHARRAIAAGGPAQACAGIRRGHWREWHVWPGERDDWQRLLQFLVPCVPMPGAQRGTKLLDHAVFRFLSYASPTIKTTLHRYKVVVLANTAPPRRRRLNGALANRGQPDRAESQTTVTNPLPIAKCPGKDIGTQRHHSARC